MDNTSSGRIGDQMHSHIAASDYISIFFLIIHLHLYLQLTRKLNFLTFLIMIFV